MKHGGMMVSRAWGLGVGLMLASSVLAVAPVDNTRVASVTARQFVLDYAINSEAEPVDSVELWYTFDEGVTWHQYGLDDDAVSPMPIQSPQEGLCGLYFVVSNATGNSSLPPSPETEPQLWVFIDYTLPIAQLHPPRIERIAGPERVVHLSWTAIDAHLGQRPITLSYRVLPDGEWMDVAPPVANAGRYDWRIPQEVVGEVMFRLIVRDRAGNVARIASAAVSVDVPVAALEVAPGMRVPHRGVAPEPTPDARRRARDLLRKGRYHALRAEHELAVARLRDALGLDPSLSEALVGLGSSLYALKKYEESAGAYGLAERLEPGDRTTLEGMARTLVALRRYAAAESKLLAIVERSPGDVEAWLHLGDVAIYRGEEVGAREYYTKAATLRPEATAVVSRAKARLKDLPSLTRNYNDPMETR